MVNGVHSNTTSLGPAVTLDRELMLGTRGLCSRIVRTLPQVLRVQVLCHWKFELGVRTKKGLVCPATTSNDTDHATGTAADNLLGARRELDAGLALVGVVADNGDVVAGRAAESATVANLLLNVGNDGTLRDGSEGKDVADGQGGVLASVDELAGVHALVGNESLGDLLEPVGRVENDASERRATARVVDDLLHDTTDVAVAFGIVEAAELGGVLPQAGVGSENAASALTLIADLMIETPWLAPSSHDFPTCSNNAPVRSIEVSSRSRFRC